MSFKIPRPEQIFVFGSNRSGIHGAGAARVAVQLYGAVPGIGEGMQGRSYAIPTKDERIQTLPLTEIKLHVYEFLRFAAVENLTEFFVTRIGCGLAGYTDEDIAPLFAGAPWNCELPEGWRKI